MIFSAFSGAAAVVNGVLILLGQIKVDALDAGIFGSLLHNGIVGHDRRGIVARRRGAVLPVPRRRPDDHLDRPERLPLLVAQWTAVARRRHRPGDDEQPLHPVRPVRAAGRQPPAGARPDHAATRLGRARRRRDPRARADLRPGRAARRGCGRPCARRRRHQQPARDDRRLVAPDRAPGPQRHRLAGHPDRRGVRAAGRRWRGATGSAP